MIFDLVIVTLGSCTLLLYIKDTEPKTSDDGS